MQRQHTPWSLQVQPATIWPASYDRQPQLFEWNGMLWSDVIVVFDGTDSGDAEAKYNAATIPEHIKELVVKAGGEVMRVTLPLMEYADIFAAHEVDIWRTTLIENDMDTIHALTMAHTDC